MTTILGVSCLGHDASVSLVADGEVRFAAHAERYSRVKNDPWLNEPLLRDALDRVDGIDLVAFYERPLWKRTRRLYAGQYRKALLDVSLRRYLARFPRLAGVAVRTVDHHLSHAAGGYFTSGFADAAIVVVDAIGEWDTLTVWEARGRSLRRAFAVRYPHSLGLFYSAFTQRTGFKPNEEEYIMMGLAALGEPRHVELIRGDFLEEVPAPRFRLKRSMHRGIRGWRPDLVDFENIAASVQAITEDYLMGLFRWVAARIPSRNLVYSGGVALNCVFNEQLARSGLFDRIWILPNPGDAGSSLGAALAVCGDRVEWTGPFLGHEIRRELNVEGAVEALAAGRCIGVAHGRAEFGPRALGNRSLLADPRGHATKDHVNRIKRREPFRPFAPAVLEEHAADYFDLPAARSPYMQYVAPCRRPDRIPAVCHVDGTSRVQTLTRRDNPAFHRLLERFHERTGCPVLLNTSLNIKGEPLANTWEDAQRFSKEYGVEVF